MTETIQGGAMIWLMLVGGACPSRIHRAKAPCWKGEIVLNFGLGHLVLGWQT